MVCPDVDIICQSEQPLGCKYGYWHNDIDECVCSPGYKGSTCSTEDKDILVGVVLSTEATPSPTPFTFNTVCVSGISGSYSFLNGDYSYDGQHELSASYKYSSYYIW